MLGTIAGDILGSIHELTPISTEQSVEIELDDETVSKIKGLFQRYDFDDYDPEEEEKQK